MSGPRFGLSMIAATYGYAKLRAPEGIGKHNVKSYLRGHIIVTCLTGLVWSGFAIYHSDWSSYASLFIAGTIVCSITIGGMMPSSAYRPAYVGLAICTLLPLAIHWILFAPTTARLIGLGFILYFFGGMYASAQAELDTRDGIIARTTKTLNEKLVKQNEIIQKTSDDKTRFLAATSHDLSQPLHAQGYFIQALRKMLSTHDQHNLLDKIESSWRAQGKLLEGLVDITRLDSHAIKPKPHALNLKTEIEVLTAEYETHAQEKNISLDAQLEEVIVFTDPVLLTRIIRNLLSNAVKFTPDNGNIDISTSETSNIANIIIRDNGIGMTPSEQATIFDEYVQLGNTNRDRSQGLGLGLSIVRRLTDLLDIDIKLTSKPGEGSCFKLSLPIHSADTLASPPQAQAQSSTIPTSPLIILVDDEKDIREGMSLLLTGLGCQIIATASGHDAMSLLNNTPTTPALLIIDKRLANEENGIEVIERLREEVNEITPAILITGDISGLDNIVPEDKIQVMNKPVEPNELIRVIRNITAS